MCAGVERDWVEGSCVEVEWSWMVLTGPLDGIRGQSTSAIGRVVRPLVPGAQTCKSGGCEARRAMQKKRVYRAGRNQGED